MRVRILRGFYYARRKVSYGSGEVVDVPKAEAEFWLKAGLAMRDKSLNGPKLTKQGG